MTSEAKRAANRGNAARSTGPRTPGGKRSSSRNAIRHGLAAILPSSGVTNEVIGLAERMVGPGQKPHAAAIEAALAQLEVERARAALRAEIAYAERSPLEEALRRIELLHRYEKRFLARRRKAFAELERLRSFP